MRRHSGQNPLTGRIGHPSRVLYGAASTALCALVLTACGTERPDGQGPAAGSDDRVAAESPPLPRTETEDAGTESPEDDETGSTDFLLFMQLLISVAEPCPDTQAEAAQEEAELSSVEKCAARGHVRRITKALKDIADPTPGQVGDVLRDLGYIDERVDGPQRSGERVEFTLDLRVLGGQLCLDGSVTGTGTAIEPYGASPEVECLDVRRTS
ncbi:hypothetical protein [Streptomyces sp. GESEQ-35]|uniref:hypothetical protein n=1 Tax=Streptomyces sp. GESEQ-35 TaxID=2812657 RepID=UPI001FF46DB9|nr:hypothetical protein [Streptomyces sp. GESEQ-35]